MVTGGPPQLPAGHARPPVARPSRPARRPPPPVRGRCTLRAQGARGRRARGTRRPPTSPASHIRRPRAAAHPPSRGAAPHPARTRPPPPAPAAARPHGHHPRVDDRPLAAPTPSPRSTEGPTLPPPPPPPPGAAAMDSGGRRAFGSSLRRPTTLAPVTPATLNARAPAYGGPPGSGPSSGLPPARRASAVPTYGGGVRRSSMAPVRDEAQKRTSSISGARGGTGGGGGGRGGDRDRGGRASSLAAHDFNRAGGVKVKECRPLGVPAYMAESSRALIAYLIHNGYKEPLSVKQLKGTSASGFKDIFVFLLRMIEPTFVLTGKVEEAVPAVLKHLGYPIALSKSSLQTIGSSHTWPALLGCLSWLRELVEYKDAAAEARSAAVHMDEDAKREALFFDFVALSYDRFLYGNDDFTELDEQLEAEFAEADAAVAAQVDALEAEHARVAADLRALTTGPSALAATRADLDAAAAEVAKYDAYNASLADYNTKLDAKVGRSAAAHAAAAERLDALDAEVAGLEATLARQAADRIDAGELGARRDALAAGLGRAADDAAATDGRRAAADGRLRDAGRVLEELVAAVNAATAALLPPGGGASSSAAPTWGGGTPTTSS
ncbi:hypothetical protein BU14_0231s0002 [Porphyra umbilicalis]|uniref:Kinetochore protein NDC80 n=1 Tax=Porphyra umbilicalis TaxID=2786 RepID=A0A1X6P3T9_PORUM|nr:hypothetical protein BU14_0231s0002 [Porphyra umbilicalis]|eukprot:OSX75549.1 hypothetical protein BU14_0231s0002 [Porphyra umbilicalis]